MLSLHCFGLRTSYGIGLQRHYFNLRFGIGAHHSSQSLRCFLLRLLALRPNDFKTFRSRGLLPPQIRFRRAPRGLLRHLRTRHTHPSFIRATPPRAPLKMASSTQTWSFLTLYFTRLNSFLLIPFPCLVLLCQTPLASLSLVIHECLGAPENHYENRAESQKILKDPTPSHCRCRKHLASGRCPSPSTMT